MGPAGRGAPAAACCSPHLPGSPVLQRGQPVPSGAERRSGTRGREERRSQARVGAAAQLPEGLRARAPWAQGLQSVSWRGGVGGYRGGRQADDSPTPRGPRLPLALRPLSPQRVPTVYICIAPSLPLRSSPCRPDSTSVVSAQGSVPFPSRPPSSPSFPHPPSPGAACCLDSPGVVFAQTFSTAVQLGDTQPARSFKTNCSFKIRPSSLVRKSAREAWLPGG